MMSDRISGVELLALYGDEPQESTRVLRKVYGKRGVKKSYSASERFRKNRSMSAKKRLRGDERMSDDELEVLLGYDPEIGAFLPGLKKAIKKIGKTTSKVTGSIAKTAAASVGIPSSAIDALSKIDPTKKGKKSAKSVVEELQKNVVTVPGTTMQIDAKKIAIIGGATVGGLIVLKMVMAPHPKQRY
jgi:hypothetical protein